MKIFFIILALSFTGVLRASDKVDSYSCYKFNEIYNSYEFYEKSNFNYETDIAKQEFVNGDREYIYFRFFIKSENISNVIYYTYEKNSSLYVVSPEDAKKLLCYTNRIEYQFNLSKYGCYKTEVYEIKFLDYDFIDSKRPYPNSSVKCISVD